MLAIKESENTLEEIEKKEELKYKNFDELSEKEVQFVQFHMLKHLESINTEIKSVKWSIRVFSFAIGLLLLGYFLGNGS